MLRVPLRVNGRRDHHHEQRQQRDGDRVVRDEVVEEAEDLGEDVEDAVEHQFAFRSGTGSQPWPPHGWHRAMRRTVSQRAPGGAVALEGLEGVGGAARVEPAGGRAAGGERGGSRGRRRAGPGRRGSSSWPRRWWPSSSSTSAGQGSSASSAPRRRAGRCRPAGGRRRWSSRSAARRRRRTRLRTHRAADRAADGERRPGAGVAAPGVGGEPGDGERAAAGPAALPAQGLERAAVGDPPELGARGGHRWTLQGGGHPGARPARARPTAACGP